MSIKSPPSSDGYDTKDAESAKDAADVTTSSKSGSLRLGQSDGGVFAVGGNIDSYKPIAQYEGAHRYDPSFQWTEKEETKLIRRVRDYCSSSEQNSAFFPHCRGRVIWAC